MHMTCNVLMRLINRKHILCSHKKFRDHQKDWKHTEMVGMIISVGAESYKRIKGIFYISFTVLNKTWTYITGQRSKSKVLSF